MTRLQNLTALFCAAIMLAAMMLFLGSISSPSPSFAGKGGGKGGGGGGGEDPPPSSTVLYRIEEIVSPTQPHADAVGMNNLGMVLGIHGDANTGVTSPYLYDHTMGNFYDLNSELGSELDLQLGTDWVFYNAKSVNDLGDLVGSITDLVTGDFRGYVVETFLSTDPNDWVLTLLPTLGSDDSYASGINNSGDILVTYSNPESGVVRDKFVYNPWADPPEEPLRLDLSSNASTIINNRVDINKIAEVAGEFSNTVFLFDSNAQSPSFTFYDINNPFIHCFNDSGVICGSAYMKLNGKGGPKRVLFRLSTISGVLDTVTEGNSGRGTQGINSTGDIHFNVSVKNSGRDQPRLLHTGFPSNQTEVIFNLDDLISPTGPLRDEWLNNHVHIEGMTNRSDTDDLTGYPRLCGYIESATDPLAFILTPFIPEP